MGAASRASAAAASLRPGARCAGCFEGLVSTPALTRRAATTATAAATRRPAAAAEGCAPAPRVALPQNAPPRVAAPAVTSPRLRVPDGRRRAPPRARRSPGGPTPSSPSPSRRCTRCVPLAAASRGAPRLGARAFAFVPTHALAAARRPCSSRRWTTRWSSSAPSWATCGPSRAAAAPPPRRAPTRVRRAAAPRGAPAALQRSPRMAAMHERCVAASPPRIRGRAARFAARHPTPALPPRRVRVCLR